jgi:sulfur relay (sulfurtransferase) DsrF/TusC family protein
MNEEKSMKALSIVESAYRATVEEQDDTIVWLTHAMKGAGAAVDLVLRGDAVNYAARGQDAGGLSFGGWRQTEPPRIEQQLASLMTKETTVFALADDLAERGLSMADLVSGIEPLDLRALAALLPRYDRVWHW